MRFWRFNTACNDHPDDPEVMISQVTAFTRQVPLLYVIGNANTIALAYTHYNIAPKLLTLIVPIPMIVFCCIRVFVWWRTGQTTMTAAAARRRLRSTIVIAGLLGAIYAVWALCLYPYGGAYERSHVAFFMSTTVIGAIFCLMHLRTAAFVLTAAVTIPFVGAFLSSGQPVLIAMAIDFLLVVLVMIVILSRYFRDFTDLVHSQVQMAALSDKNFRMANLDSLTGLPNRRSFFAEVTRTFEQDVNDGKVFALGILDLDGFKPVNDVFGHGAGDRVLIEVGRRLTELLGPTAIVARLGGDEFGLLVPDEPDERSILATGYTICRIIEQPIPLLNGFAKVSASIGFALGSDEGATWEHLFEKADYALLRAKAKQRGTALLFSSQHASAIKSKSLIEQELRRADFDAEMEMQYQPIVDVVRHKTIAFEALARWRSPRLGSVPPIDFIAAAERMGLINRLTETLFGKALAALQGWPESIELSFNLSVRDLSSADLIGRIQTMIEASRIAPHRIAFEITESALVQDFDQANAMLQRLKSIGVSVSLDDFGTGYSSLSYVHKLPFDKIKIDRSFVNDITTDKTSHDIIKSIIDLCRNLKLNCIVEGVETTEQIAILRSLGCTWMQGYHLGRPANGSDLVFDDEMSARPNIEAA